VEYQDADFLHVVGQEHLAQALGEFWPARGRVWDALAVVEQANGSRGVILVEGKSQTSELSGSGSMAGMPTRRQASRQA
jgi:hypothetical protein